MKLLNIGFGNLVNEAQILAIVSPDAAPIKRLIHDAQESGKLIDASCGRKTKSVIITQSDHVILSAYTNEKLLGLTEQKEDENGQS